MSGGSTGCPAIGRSLVRIPLPADGKSTTEAQLTGFVFIATFHSDAS